MKIPLRILAFAALAFGFISLKPDFFPSRDFVEYWSAAHVLAHGGNPYDGAELLTVQRTVDDEVKDKAVSLWTPPWTLPLYLPFGFLPFALAHKVWLIVQLVCLGAAAEMLFQPTRNTVWAFDLLPYLVLVLFSPVFWNLHFGQNTAFILLGLAGFLRFRETRPVLAGAFVALTAIKPHLLAVFGVVLILDAMRHSGRRALLGGIGVLAIGSAIALAFDARIFAQFAEAVTKPSTAETVSLKDWNVPVFSYHLRQAVAPNIFWTQFIPCLVTSVLAAVYYFRRRAAWDWHRELPRIVTVSMVVAPYGAWIFDLTLLLVPLFAGAVMVIRTTDFACWAPYFGGLMIASIFGLKIGGLADAWWFTPAFAGLYLFAEFYRSGRSRSFDR